VSWTGLIAELCRVARRTVVVDYPSRRSVSVLSERLFGLKKGIEHNPHPFLLFTPQEIPAAFAGHGFTVPADRPQFLFPMALHRWGNRAELSRLSEAPGRLLGLNRWFGSPIIARADRPRT
jgi:hypothetical protein